METLQIALNFVPNSTATLTGFAGRSFEFKGLAGTHYTLLAENNHKVWQKLQSCCHLNPRIHSLLLSFVPALYLAPALFTLPASYYRRAQMIVLVLACNTLSLIAQLVALLLCLPNAVCCAQLVARFQQCKEDHHVTTFIDAMGLTYRNHTVLVELDGVNALSGGTCSDKSSYVRNRNVSFPQLTTSSEYCMLCS